VPLAKRVRAGRHRATKGKTAIRLSDVGDLRRRVPRTDSVLADPRLSAASRKLGRDTVKQAVILAQDQARAGEIGPEQVSDTAVALLPARSTGLRPVLNATGVLLHTNLGRAPLSTAAREAVDAAAGCTDVEFDLETGSRGQRGRSAFKALEDAVPEAEAVHVVNNNAAALVLAATALAHGREIVISRGEMVEIGDGFRIPDLLTSTGARLREVGTTNRTVLDDYAAAIGESTGFILKVHPSNFQIEGFTSSVNVRGLATLGIPVVVDIGSGLLAREPLLPDEPDAATTLRDGASLVTASGDKLLGGPQAGLLLGRAEMIVRLRRHPLARALRVDKLTLAALEATLRGPANPTWRGLHADPDELRNRAERLADTLSAKGVPADAVNTEAHVGGGGAPGVALPSAGVELPDRFAIRLRAGEPAVVGRIERGRCVLDLRTVPADADDQLYAAVLAAAAEAAAADGGES
jgi:L-seryl-tRNA(Ser) seleniumtransferase